MAAKYLSASNFAGLTTAPGQLGEPPGGMSVAQNWDIPNRTLLAKRRGMQRYTSFPSGVARSVYVKSASALGGSPVLYAAAGISTTVGTSSLLSVGSSAVTLPAPLTPAAADPSVRPVRFVQFGKSVYASTDNGVVRIESDNAARWAGVETPVARTATAGAGTGAWLATGSTVAYRAVLVRYDADGVPMRGPPSGEVFATSTGPASIVTVGIWLNAAVNSYDATEPSAARRVDVELYRSPSTTTATPSAELQLCYRRQLTAGELATPGTAVSITDLCPDEGLGAYLYTNGITGEDVLAGAAVGLASRNDIPPVGADVASYAGRLWLADLTYRHELTFSLFAPGTTGTQLKTGDVLTIDGSTYTAGTNFTVYTAGTVLQNIQDTARSLASAIASHDASICAEYVGSPLSPGTAGLIRVWRARNSAASFSVQVTSGGSGPAFVPDLSTALSSSSERLLNGLAYSKASQPDAFAPANVVRVGRGDASIRRIVALRDCLFIFASDGLWRLTGYSPETFALEMFDSSVVVAAVSPNAIAVMDDAIYAWCNLGIVRITTSGVEMLDDAIRDFVSLQGTRRGSFAVADSTRKRVLFFLGNDSAGNPYPSAHRALVYHARAQAWTLYHYGATSPKTCGASDAATGLVYLGNADDGAGTVLGPDETVEWVYRFGSGARYGDIAVERTAYAAALWGDTNNARAAQAITSVARWTSAAPDPMAVAQWRELHLFASPSEIVSTMSGPTAWSAAFRTEMMAADETVAVTVPLEHQVRVMVPRGAARGARMTVQATHSVVDEYASLAGYGLVYTPDGTEVSR